MSEQNHRTRRTKLLLALLAALSALFVSASSASALQIGVQWSGVWKQSETTSEWNVIQHSGSNVYRLMLWKDKWESGNCTPSQCEPCTISKCEAYDPIFRKAAERNITILPYFFNGGYPQSGEPAYEQWYSFIKTVVKRYGYNGQFWQENGSLHTPVTAWELGNEPNLGVENNNYGGGGVPNPTRYGNFLVYMSNAVRTASTEQSGQGTTVLMAGLYLGSVSEGSMNWETFLNQAYNVSGFYSSFDGISIHPYGFDYAHSEAGKKTISESTGEITAIRNFLANKTWGPSRSLWITEIGWPVGVNPKGGTGVDDANQSRLLTESFNWVKNHQGVQGQANNNKIESLIWYNLRDNVEGEKATNPGWPDRCGLLRGDRSARPAWTAFQSQTGAASWTPPAEQAPGVETQAATEVTSTSATLHGTVNPNGLPTTYRFEYGTTPSYGSSIPVPDGSAGEGEGSVSKSALVGSLEPGKTYYYRISATNPVNTSYGSQSSFSTKLRSKPAVLSQSNGDREIYFRSSSGQLQWWYWNNAKGWTLESRGSTGAMAGDPAALEQPNGDRQIFYRTPSGLLQWWYWNNAKGTWTLEWNSSANDLAGDPTPVNDSSGGEEIYYRSTSGQLKWLWWSTTKGWSLQWIGSTGAMAGDPAVLDQTNGDRQIFYRTPSGLLQWWYWSNAKGWTQEWLGSTNALASDPTPVNDSSGGEEIYYAGMGGPLTWWWWSTTKGWSLQWLSGAEL